MHKWIISDPEFESDHINSELKVSPWSGHRYFVYDLIRYIQPQLIVELGSHYGCSLFAFCQALKDFNLSSKIIAIDTWQGDPQAGYYGEEVFNLVNQTKEKFFSTVEVELKRKLFSEAALEIKPSTADIIHIDGLHTYEAVKEDFETWLPKLRDDGVILFHDIASYTGYGSAEFWKEIKDQYPSISFNHSWGLGLLFPKGSRLYDKLISGGIDEKVLLYTSKSELELYKIKVVDLEKMSLERLDAINNQSQMIEERDRYILELESKISEKQTIIENQSQMLEERYLAILKMEQMIKQRDEVVSAQEKLIEDRMDAITNMESMIKQRDEAIIVQKKLLNERLRAMKEMEEMIQQRDETIIGQKYLLDERFKAMKEMEEMIKERDAVIESQTRLVEERYHTIENMDTMIKERDDVIQSQQKLIEERYAAIRQMEVMIVERDNIIKAQQKMIEERTGY